MFRRRDKLSVGKKIQSWVWPRGGWRRTWRYLVLRLARMPGSVYSIAAGFACGAAASFTPFVGLHIVLSAIAAWVMRANVLASAIGTIVGNPWTFPLIWLWLYESGTWFLMGTAGPHESPPDFHATFSALTDTAMRLDAAGFLAAAGPVFWPMFLSSIPTTIIVWVAFYFPIRNMVRGYQQHRTQKPEASLHRRQERERKGERDT